MTLAEKYPLGSLWESSVIAGKPVQFLILKHAPIPDRPTKLRVTMLFLHLGVCGDMDFSRAWSAPSPDTKRLR